MKQGRETHIRIDVRTKLLVMLALLSLPLLVISLIQFRSYQRSLNEQARTIARIEASAAAGALESWLEANRPLAEQPAPLTPVAARELYNRLQKHASPSADASITVIDGRGEAVPNPSSSSSSTPTYAPGNFPAGIVQHRWSDGVWRVTSMKRLDPFGWSVAVGVPLPEYTPAGRSVLIVAATWFVALLASILLSVWA
ncbi:MAG: hypothetical protein ACRD68_16645, partial [Pyrinomonadaceae bacterium]